MWTRFCFAWFCCGYIPFITYDPYEIFAWMRQCCFNSSCVVKQHWRLFKKTSRYQGPLLLRWINFNPACINNYINEITSPSQNFNGSTVEIWEWINNFNVTLHWICDYLSMSGFKLNRVSKRGPRASYNTTYAVKNMIINHTSYNQYIICGMANAAF